ncbi:hypothetical protein [Massilia eburnea]|uniref:hypothetical protein n=1 Tax=Massilia eburnea TaxID=1776165 RepID=UPI003D6B363F
MRARKPVARMVTSLLMIVLAVYVAVCAVVFFRQRSMIYFPQAFEGGTVLALDGSARVGVTLQEQPGPSAVIYFGGNAEAVGDSLPELQAVFPGQALYLMHYRGYGATAGEPSEAGLFADAQALYEYVRARHPQVTLVGTQPWQRHRYPAGQLEAGRPTGAGHALRQHGRRGLAPLPVAAGALAAARPLRLGEPRRQSQRTYHHPRRRARRSYSPRQQ